MAVLEGLVEALVGLADGAGCAEADVVVGVGEREGGEEGLDEESEGAVVVQEGVVQVLWGGEAAEGGVFPVFELEVELVHLGAEGVEGAVCAVDLVLDFGVDAAELDEVDGEG